MRLVSRFELGGIQRVVFHTYSDMFHLLVLSLLYTLQHQIQSDLRKCITLVKSGHTHTGQKSAIHPKKIHFENLIFDKIHVSHTPISKEFLDKKDKRLIFFPQI